MLKVAAGIAMDVGHSDGGTPVHTVQKDCTILVVDDDPECLDEYREAISNLGYPVACAASASNALKQIADSPDIGVVLTDIEMPSMDGISLLSEIAHRFSSNRPIVTLVVTAHSSLEVATKAMQSRATDLLIKPVGMGDLASALRRASAHYFATATQFQFTAPTERPDPLVGNRSAKRDTAPSGQELQSFIQMLLKFQHSKSRFFAPEVLAGPSWEILLDITEANLRGEPIPASSASATTLVPLSTALRRVKNLVEFGLVRSWTDPTDKRRTLLELEPHALVAMQSYLKSAWQLHARSK